MKKLLSSPWIIPIALLLLSILSFGLLAPWLGFYWDDWFFAYSTHVFGPGGFGSFMAHDRPPSQFYYALVSFILGEAPLAYQILAITLRCLCAAALWWLVSKTWPASAKRFLWVPFLFLVYPGFYEQSIAFTYAVHWGGYLLTILSLGLMVCSLRTPRRFWPLTGLAVLFSTSIFSIEYQFGLEFVRPLLIWFVLSETIPQNKKRLTGTLRYWLPYLMVPAAYILWRGVLFKSNLLAPETVHQMASSPLSTLLNFGQVVFQDFFKTSLIAWTQIFNRLVTIDFSARAEWLYWGIVILSGLLVFLFFNSLKSNQTEEAAQSRTPAVQVVVLGAWAMLAAGAPFVISLFPHEMVFPYDRFSLPYMFGVSLLSGGLLELLVRTYRQKVVLAAILIAFAVGFQFDTANTFRREWDNQGAFFWQVSWRIPALKPGTLLLTIDLPFQYNSDYSLTAPLNWMYSPQQKDSHLPYLMYFIKSRLGSTGLQSLAPNVPVAKDLRNFTFTGSTSQTLLFYYSPPGCFRVLDPARPEEYPALPPALAEAGGLARTDLIDLNPPVPAAPPAHYFSDPGKSWCYYYEKADLARQAGDWKQVSSLGEAALKLDKQAQDPSEYFVFLEAAVINNHLDQANALSKNILDKNEPLKTNLCMFWKRMEQALPANADVQSVAGQWLAQLKCK